MHYLLKKPDRLLWFDAYLDGYTKQTMISKPENVDLYINGIFSGTCPLNLKLSDSIHIIEAK